MKYRMYVGDSPHLDALCAAGIVHTEHLAALKRQECEFEDDDEAREHVEEFEKATGFAIRAITCVGDHGEERIVYNGGVQR